MIKTHASLFSGIGAAEIAADWMVSPFLGGGRNP